MHQVILSTEEVALIIGALDTLGALVRDEHHWSDGERAIYEEAIKLLKNGNEG